MSVLDCEKISSDLNVNFSIKICTSWIDHYCTDPNSDTDSYVSKKSNPYSDSQAIQAMKLIAPNLRTVYHDGNNKKARDSMMLGSTLAGIAFSNASVALVHGMSRPIGAIYHVPHGLSNAMLLPSVTKYSIPSAFLFAKIRLLLVSVTSNTYGI